MREAEVVAPASLSTANLYRRSAVSKRNSTLRRQSLNAGKRTSKSIDIPIGTRFGRLVVIGKSTTVKTNRGSTLTASICQCDCGSIGPIPNSELKRGRRVSCGCGRNHEQKSKRRLSKEVYWVWASMKQRCENPKCKSYERYGARGIDVCEDWSKSFDAFYRDMGNRPQGMTIERIDNKRGYSKDNCRWASIAEQNRNKRGSKLLTFNGVTKNLVDWSRAVGIEHGIISRRLKTGLSVELALTLPVGTRIKRLSASTQPSEDRK